MSKYKISTIKDMKIIIFTKLFCLSLLSINALAHQDKTLKISGNEITGLPAKYEPCLIDWANNKMSINGKEADFPIFISNVLRSNRITDENGDVLLKVGVNWKLVITASWFHDKSDANSLPDYMIFNFHPENKDYYFSVVFDLEKPAVVGSRVILTTFSKKDGDKWVNSERKISDSLMSTHMELVIDGNANAASFWEKNACPKVEDK